MRVLFLQFSFQEVILIKTTATNPSTLVRKLNIPSIILADITLPSLFHLISPQNIANLSTRGLSAFSRYSSKVSSKYIRGQMNMTVAQLNEHLICSNVHTLYMIDTIDSWIREYSVKNSQQKEYNKTVGVLILCLITVIHLITNQFLLRAYFNRKNSMKKFIYDYYISSLVLQDDKTIKQKLIMGEIIQPDS